MRDRSTVSCGAGGTLGYSGANQGATSAGRHTHTTGESAIGVGYDRQPVEPRDYSTELLGRCRGNADALQLIAEVERIVRFELECPPPAPQQLVCCLTASNARPAQRIAVISDIHGNHAGLMAALDDIAAQGCDRIVCLGDLVEGGPDNDRVIETLRERGVPCVRGNHDENNDVALSNVTRQFLNALPESIVEDYVLFIHISPRAKKRKIDHVVEAWNVFEESDY